MKYSPMGGMKRGSKLGVPKLKPSLRLMPKMGGKLRMPSLTQGIKKLRIK